MIDRLVFRSLIPCLCVISVILFYHICPVGFFFLEKKKERKKERKREKEKEGRKEEGKKGKKK
jgi:hypothetical protein